MMTVFKLLIPLLLLATEQPARDLAVRVFPPRPAQGRLVVVQVEGARPGDRVSGVFAGRKLRFFIDEQGRVRALSAVAWKQPPGDASLVVTLEPPQGDAIIQGVAVPVLPGKFETQELSVDSKYVRPPRNERARIRSERAALKIVWRAPPTQRKWRGSFVWPCQGEISSPFGARRMFNRKLKSRHFGVDIDQKTGDPVRAVGAGRVVMVAERYYSGGTVIVDHGLRLFSLYFHLSEFLVNTGDMVERGQLIGKVGGSGRATGPHLHLGTRVEGLSFDPLSLLEFDLGEGEARP
jgi:murein DD-endopeptidase MepM/ murein hydrolase activator NlpD